MQLFWNCHICITLCLMHFFLSLVLTCSCSLPQRSICFIFSLKTRKQTRQTGIQPQPYSSSVKGDKARLWMSYWIAIIKPKTDSLIFYTALFPGQPLRGQSSITWTGTAVVLAVLERRFDLLMMMADNDLCSHSSHSFITVAHGGQFDLRGPARTWWKKELAIDNELVPIFLTYFHLYSMCCNISTLKWKYNRDQPGLLLCGANNRSSLQALQTVKYFHKGNLNWLITDFPNQTT